MIIIKLIAIIRGGTMTVCPLCSFNVIGTKLLPPLPEIFWHALTEFHAELP